MRVIIAGGRDVLDAFKLITVAIIASGFDISEVVSGTARGVDRAGEDWAMATGFPITRMPADWDNNGKAAGHIRNREMADYADALVAIWDGKSRGTKNMIDVATKLNLKVYVHLVK